MTRADWVRVFRAVLNRLDRPDFRSEHVPLIETLLHELLVDGGYAKELRKELAIETEHCTPTELEAMRCALIDSRRHK